RAVDTVLQQTAAHLTFLDGQYNVPLPVKSIAIALQPFFADAEQIVAPLGLMHPDHVKTAAACRMTARTLGITALAAYEESPAAVVWAWSAREGRRNWKREGWSLHQVPIDTNLLRKHRAVAQYRSQAVVPELTFANLREERLWRACG